MKEGLSLKGRREAATKIAQNILGDGVRIELEDAELVASEAREAMLDRQATLLEEMELALVDELKRTVLKLSAEIEVVSRTRRELVRQAGQEHGLRLAATDWKGVDAHEEEKVVASGRDHQNASGAAGQNTISTGKGSRHKHQLHLPDHDRGAVGTELPAEDRQGAGH